MLSVRVLPKEKNEAGKLLDEIKNLQDAVKDLQKRVATLEKNSKKAV